jgi:hypothetical protein
VILDNLRQDTCGRLTSPFASEAIHIYVRGQTDIGGIVAADTMRQSQALRR